MTNSMRSICRAQSPRHRALAFALLLSSAMLAPGFAWAAVAATSAVSGTTGQLVFTVGSQQYLMDSADGTFNSPGGFTAAGGNVITGGGCSASGAGGGVTLTNTGQAYFCGATTINGNTLTAATGVLTNTITAVPSSGTISITSPVDITAGGLTVNGGETINGSESVSGNLAINGGGALDISGAGAGLTANDVNALHAIENYACPSGEAFVITNNGTPGCSPFDTGSIPTIPNCGAGFVQANGSSFFCGTPSLPTPSAECDGDNVLQWNGSAYTCVPISSLMSASGSGCNASSPVSDPNLITGGLLSSLPSDPMPNASNFQVWNDVSDGGDNNVLAQCQNGTWVILSGNMNPPQQNGGGSGAAGN